MNVTTLPSSNRTLPMRTLMALVRPFRPLLVKPPSNLDSKLEWSLVGSPRLDVLKSLRKEFVVTERCVEDIWCYDIDRRRGSKGDDTGGGGSSRIKRIYYFCGGGFQAPPSSDHWSFIAQLVRQTPSIRLTVISYPLAPRVRASTAISALSKAYRALMSESARAAEVVSLVGDSSGANVALCVTLYTLALGKAIQPDPETEGSSSAPAQRDLTPTPAPVPAPTPALAPSQLVLISPCVDCSNNNPEMKGVNRHDPVLTVTYTGQVADTWRGTDISPSDPLVSPAKADLSLLTSYGVRIEGIVGTWDVLAPDTLEFIEACRAAGLHGDWLVAEGQMHCYPLAWRYKLKNCVDGKDWIINTIHRSRRN
ncbi:hypothetical protein I317_05039 [Kwoniella heveanensis CBS 569]|nr:hypothetical protein I317_05039 [Kwoniella heveanensis CBS 569]